MEDEANRIGTDKAIGNRGSFILSPIRELDVFASRAVEVVFANVHPSFGDVVNIREDFLIHNNLVGSTRMMNRIERTLGGGFNSGNTDIHRIQTTIYTRR